MRPTDSFDQLNRVRIPVGKGEELSVIDEGPREAPIIMMLHGNPTWSYFYHAVIDQFKGQYRCIVPDHLGMGHSTRPQYEVRLQDHIDNIKKCQETLQIQKYHLMVHDWGGAIGMGVAVDHTEQVQKIVIMNTAAFLSQEIPSRIRFCRSQPFGRWAVRGMNAFAKGAVSMAVTRKMPVPIAEKFLEPYANWENRSGIWNFLKDIPVVESHPTYETVHRIENQLEKLKQHQILLMWGAKDFCFTLNYFNRWCKFFPEAERKVFDDAGHYLLEDAGQEALDQVSEFLAKGL